MKQRFKSLEALTALKWELARADLKPVLEQEQRLRSALRDLQKPSKSCGVQAGRFTAERSGATRIWEAWTAERQTELNGQLALVLAEKEEKLQFARAEFSRKEAMRLIAKGAAKR